MPSWQQARCIAALGMATGPNAAELHTRTDAAEHLAVLERDYQGVLRCSQRLVAQWVEFGLP